MGKTVVEGERNIRFSPKYPNIMPQFSMVDDILANSQRSFYALKIKKYPESLNFHKDSNLEIREIEDAWDEFPVQTLSSVYISDEHRIRDGDAAGPKVVTFARILKYDMFPLAGILSDVLEIGRKGMGAVVEIEFSLDLDPAGDSPGEFNFLQIRPMVAGGEHFDVRISREEIDKAFCFSAQALGHGKNEELADIIYVKPDDFKPENTVRIAGEIGRLNADMLKEKRQYLLVGPGRWGSNDRWLGIPVQWQDISGVGAMIEMRNDNINADPSQGTHFFQNITSMGIHYITVTEGADVFKWQWINSLPVVRETGFLRHVRLEKPFILKVDSKESRCVMFENEE
jgi:hypothetical protein